LSAAQVFDPNVVKVVRASDERALYFSRASIPWDRAAFAGGQQVAALDAYLQQMAQASLKPLSARQRLAYWINLYNAAMVDVILDRYEPGYSVSENEWAVFKEKFIGSPEGKVSLDGIEHEIIRKRFPNAPGIHAALVCGAVSCPPLIREAYTGETIIQALEANTHRWIHEPRRNVIDHDSQTLRLSSIFDWYAVDFDAKIQSRAVGWVVRAPDTKNFYEFKLFQGGSEANPTYSLARYSMLDGVKTLVAEGIEAPAHLVKSDDFNRISMRVVGANVTTLINGWGVDHWRDGQLKRGGVGLIADAGESALIRQMTVSGNDDTWGLILYGAIESMHSVQEFFGGGEAPAAILFYRPGGMTGGQPAFLLQGPPRR